MSNRTVFKGVVRGKTIELERDPGLPDGHSVTVVVQPSSDQSSSRLDDQYEAGYKRIPEDASEAEALLPHLPLPEERWE